MDLCVVFECRFDTFCLGTLVPLFPNAVSDPNSIMISCDILPLADPCSMAATCKSGPLLNFAY